MVNTFQLFYNILLSKGYEMSNISIKRNSHMFFLILQTGFIAYFLVFCCPMALAVLPETKQNTQVKNDFKLPEGLSYNSQKKNNHIIHILSIDPKYYRLDLVKAHNQVFGRETVKSIALRKGAIAAINAGFFEIGNSEDGRPSGTLIINGDIFSLAKNKRALLVFNENKLDMGNIEIEFNLLVGKEKIAPNKINQFAKNDDIILYNHTFGPTSLTPYDRREILIDKKGIITQIVEHGDNAIPRSGWILSFPSSHSMDFAKVGKKVTFNTTFKDPQNQNNAKWAGMKNFLMGIPMLVENGQAITDLEKLGSKSFAEKPHARTALGVKSEGTLVMVVVEHTYSQALEQITIEQMRNILREKGHTQKAIEEMKTLEMFSIIRDEISNESNIGLSLPDLANLMVTLGCHQAINLDGGGSSTLFLNGHIMNTTIGDKDESQGLNTLRPVSDAIVVTKRI